ncbi:ATP-binding protein [Clostridium botulinum D/C]|uniref:AAA family ATPase n=1 Tax=Clostridium botulinum TaxID=1491 RepID=UPI001E456B14|nr:AAA family ATPase [Clostridium botulinum]MCD3351591.1 ATP-binding protein [Clostridium botulinum D/C]MCD3360536.1 ATP-binding protein [Clostridium botulinum D/C]MCD3362206.1 ATP-binding protein [Clostridium botulinum D/C]MCD3366292.1 ATP-binding protein [Clostridium botulinum D/C]
MINMESLVNAIYVKICESKQESHSDYIIVGNNMSGKSELIRNLIERYIQGSKSHNLTEKYINKITSQGEIYFIDSCNRTISKDNPIGMFSEINDIFQITTERLKPINFNKVDKIGFNYDNHLILNELLDNKEMYKDILQGYFEESFDIVTYKEDSSIPLLSSLEKYKYKIGDTIYENLSNGYQAIIRLLVEIQYAVSKGVKVILIDEVVLYLDANNSRKFIEFIQNTFNEIHWIFTTHSPEVICASSNFNIIKVKENNYEIYDGNNLNDLESTIEALFDQDIIENDEFDTILENLVRLKSMGEILPKYDLERIKSEQNLSSVQKLYREYVLNDLVGQDHEN